jgi:hypothetical protein
MTRSYGSLFALGPGKHGVQRGLQDGSRSDARPEARDRGDDTERNAADDDETGARRNRKRPVWLGFEASAQELLRVEHEPLEIGRERVWAMLRLPLLFGWMSRRGLRCSCSRF